MNYYFAPLEGLTDSVYRKNHHRYFPGVHRYYMPFLSPTVHRSLTNRENRELPYADTVDFAAVPQLLTKVPEDFLWAAEQCKERGYEEVNLNLGCPSGTVVAKGKGAGMLKEPESLARFFEAVFAKTPLPISVKTRLGMEDPAEFPAILEVLNQFPIQELILHPRVRSAFYSGSVDMEAFSYCVANSRAPVCYNGSLNSLTEIETFSMAFPQVRSVMLGRGLIGDPGMVSPEGTTADKLENMYQDLLEAYLSAFGGSRNAMFRLKENWRYLICRFVGGEKLYKRLRKTTDLEEYRSLTAQILHTLPLADKLHADW